MVFCLTLPHSMLAKGEETPMVIDSETNVITTERRKSVMCKDPILDAIREDEVITISIADEDGTRLDFELDSVTFLENLLAMVEMRNDEDGILPMPFTTWTCDSAGNRLLISRSH